MIVEAKIKPFYNLIYLFHGFEKYNEFNRTVVLSLLEILIAIVNY